MKTILRRARACLRARRGFSLVELLVGVLILSVIVAPLLNSFVTAAHTANRSRKVGDATQVAQTVIETVDTMELPALIAAVEGNLLMGSNAQFYNADLDPVTDAAGFQNGTEDTLRVGLTGLAGSANSFSAMLTIDADPFNINETDVVEFTPMDVVFSQPAGERNPDLKARTELAAQAENLGTVRSRGSIRRTVRADIRALSADVVTVSVSYVYRQSVTYVPLGGTLEDSDTVTVRYDYENFFRGEPEDIQALYLFYYPNYASGVEDVIEIWNQNNVALTCFLVKQAEDAESDYGYSSTELASRDGNYRARVDQYELSAGSPTAATAVRSNIDRSILTGEQRLGALSYRVFRSGTLWYQSSTFDGGLVAEKSGQRLYHISVSLFEPGGDYGGEPIMTLTGSALK